VCLPLPDGWTTPRTPRTWRRTSYTNPNQPVSVRWPYGSGFDVRGHIAHCFWKHHNVTLDFTDMNLYTARGKPADRARRPGLSGQ
jgi:hypothetical protein